MVDWQRAFFEIARYFALLDDHGRLIPRAFTGGYLGMPMVTQIIAEQT
jgi:hypothetical protein